MKEYKFKIGHYYVPLNDDARNNNWNGWVLKQRTNCDTGLRPTRCPNTGSGDNLWFQSIMDWREATPDEIERYIDNGGPVKACDNWVAPSSEPSSYTVW